MPTPSPQDTAALLLEACRAGRPYPDSWLDQLIEADPRWLFAGVIEPLCDAFEPAYCDVYAGLFARVIERTIPALKVDELLGRYHRIRRPRAFTGDPAAVDHVFVLSRVTLGADVAVTSVLLDAARKRFPRAFIHFVGSPKAAELFSGDPRVHPISAAYGRIASLRDRLNAGLGLQKFLNQPGSIVLDPDSRLTQLGLLPVCGEESYFFFESRSYGGCDGETVGTLARRWTREVLGVEDATPYIAPGVDPAPHAAGRITVSLGVGENPGKRVPDPYETELLRALAARGHQLLVDYGSGEDEISRVDRAIAASGARPGQIETWKGTFAPFAGAIALSRLYIGYDSSGQHVAATCGVPLVTVFTGYATPRTFDRWRPAGPGPMRVLRYDRPDPAHALADTIEAVEQLL